MRVEGQVIKQMHGAGSKSEHEAVYLKSPKGAYKLRLPGGNPFSDPRLDELVGKSISGHGTVDRVSNQLFLSDWAETPALEPTGRPRKKTK
jgi:hypothetical protein